MYAHDNTSLLKVYSYIIKCNWIHLGPLHGFGEDLIDSTAITSCKIARDLGILIDNQLKFHDHTTAVSQIANRIL